MYLERAREVINRAAGAGSLFAATPITAETGGKTFLMTHITEAPPGDEYEGYLRIQTLLMLGTEVITSPEDVIRMSMDLCATAGEDPERTLSIMTEKQNGTQFFFEYMDNEEFPKGKAALIISASEDEPHAQFFINNTAEGEHMELGIQEWPDASVFEQVKEGYTRDWNFTMARTHAMLMQMLTLSARATVLASKSRFAGTDIFKIPRI